MPQPRSLKHRLLLATLLTAGLTLLAAGFILSSLFREHVRQQFVERLSADLDQVMARLQVNASGQPVLDPATLSDPRWSRPRSGLYWQVDAAGPGAHQPALLRSRSLWDEQLDAPRDLRRRRGVERDGPSFEAVWERWEASEVETFARDGGRERADLVVDGTASR